MSIGRISRIKQIQHVSRVVAGAGGLWAAGLQAAPAAAEPVVLANEHWRIAVEPRWGGRISSLRDRKTGYEFVSCWKAADPAPKAKTTNVVEMVGGAFRTMMSGSYRSVQPQEPYAVVGRTDRDLRMVYTNAHPLLNGLREERRIALDGNAVILAVRVTNDSAEKRHFYYRLQDYLGAGPARSVENVLAAPWREGSLHAQVLAGQSVYQPFLNPAENWFVLADLVGDKALLATVSRAGVAGFFFWCSADDPSSRAAEVFFQHAQLDPGRSWEMELRYTRFAPSAPALPDAALAGRVSAASINRALQQSSERVIAAGLPYDAELALPVGGEPARLAPVHLIDPALERGRVPDYGKTLQRVHLRGTPGEAVPLIFGVTTERPLRGAKVTFRADLPGLKVESRYLADDTLLLVRSWELARNIPRETICTINNDVREAPELTPFSLDSGETAVLYNLFRIPADAPAGVHAGTCTVETDVGVQLVFDIQLTVRPFALTRARHKTYSGFFRYFIKSGAGGDSGAETAVTREQYLAALKTAADTGYNGLVIYVSARDDLVWVLEQCRALGMTGAYVLCRSGNLTREDIAELKQTYNILGWGVDEPTRYSQIPSLLRKYKAITARGLTPVFTPNVPLGLLAADALEGIVPVIAMSGNMAYGLAATRRYKDQGRQVFWYRTGQAAASVEQRVFRGIYLWKEPVDGMLDWGEDSVARGLSNQPLCGFAGAEVIPRLGRENIRQALIDLDYLHTLDLHIARCADPVLKARAERLTTWIKTTFEDDWYWAIAPIRNPQYLDDIRQEVGDMIEALVAAAQ